jgi:two-component system nitrate/nitrite response regulator NarL
MPCYKGKLMNKPIHVLLADDHPAMRIGLRVLLDQASDIKVIAETGDGKETLAQIEALQPDVVILDCQLPKLSGIEVAAKVKQQNLPVRLLALSAHDNPKYQWGMLEMGAAGYLLKDEAPTEIVAAVRAVAQGQQLWKAEQFTRARHWQQEVQARWLDLTEQERKVLTFIASGKSNKEISQELNITARTVEFHVSNILNKLGVTSRVEAAIWLKTYGLGSQSAE